MSLEKCQKYLYKLLNTNIDNNKFGLYLSKLNYWYEQIGGAGKCCKSNSGKRGACIYWEKDGCDVKRQVEVTEYKTKSKCESNNTCKK